MSSDQTKRGIDQQAKREQDAPQPPGTLFDVVPVGYLTLRSNGIIQDINLAGAELLGCDRSLLTGHPLTHFVTEAERPGLITFLAMASRSSRKETWEVTIPPGDPPLSLRIVAMASPGGDICHMALTNITPCKVMEEQFRASEAHLNEAQRLTKLGSWKRDFLRNTLSWSAGMFLISELTPAQFNDNFENFLAIVHPDDRELLLRTAHKAHCAQLPYDLEYRLTMTDGRVKWVHSRANTSYDRDGHPLTMTGTHQDITERKLAQEELFHTKGLRNLIIDAVPAFISYVDRECRYQVVNRRYEELTGLSVSQIRGRHVRDVLSESSWAIAAPYIARVLAGEEVTYETEVRDADGNVRTLQASHTPDRTPQGQVRGYVALIHDITEKNKTEQTLQSYVSLSNTFAV
jgi:PAS domain S-box-containing protein